MATNDDDVDHDDDDDNDDDDDGDDDDDDDDDVNAAAPTHRRALSPERFEHGQSAVEVGPPSSSALLLRIYPGRLCQRLPPSDTAGPLVLQPKKIKENGVSMGKVLLKLVSPLQPRSCS